MQKMIRGSCKCFECKKRWTDENLERFASIDSRAQRYGEKKDVGLRSFFFSEIFTFTTGSIRKSSIVEIAKDNVDIHFMFYQPRIYRTFYSMNDPTLFKPGIFEMLLVFEYMIKRMSIFLKRFDDEIKKYRADLVTEDKVAKQTNVKDKKGLGVKTGEAFTQTFFGASTVVEHVITELEKMICGWIWEKSMCGGRVGSEGEEETTKLPIGKMIIENPEEAEYELGIDLDLARELCLQKINESSGCANLNSLKKKVFKTMLSDTVRCRLTDDIHKMYDEIKSTLHAALKT